MSHRDSTIAGQAADTVADLGASVKSGVESAAHHLHDAAGDAASTARHAGQRMADRGEKLADNARYLARDVQHRAEELLWASEKYIVRQPLQSVLIAAGVGALVASVILLAARSR